MVYDPRRAKVSDKINVVRRFFGVGRYPLNRGGIANTFGRQGHAMGDSFYEKDRVDEAARLLEESQKRLPGDVAGDLIVTRELKADSPFKNVAPGAVEEDEAVDGMSSAAFQRGVGKAGMVIWSGRKFLKPAISRGTEAVARACRQRLRGRRGRRGRRLESLFRYEISFISTGAGDPRILKERVARHYCVNGQRKLNTIDRRKTWWK